ncbi:matrin-3-like isoform X2 [Pseudophryne corroboree]|uniref:matrin-3-like isoform X2 n=1 Tax=Pseudophryne corroboree TaxID=495146 RepID=UPI003081882C
MTSHHRHDSSGMGLLSANPSLNLPSSLGRMSQGSGRRSAFKFSHQGSRGMRPSNSSRGLPPIFGHGNRPAPPSSSQPRVDTDETSKVLASFGFSPRDLDEWGLYPVEKITPKNLPQIILDLKRRRSENMALQNLREGPSREPLRVSSDDTRPFRRDHFNDRSSGLDTVVDYGRGSRSEDHDYRDRLAFEGRLRERERLREERFRPDASYHKVDNVYKRMGFSRSQERSMYGKTRGMPSNRNIDDFHGVPPKGFPYLCSLCDKKITSQQIWNDHVQGRAHCNQQLQLIEMGGSHTPQQPKNAAAGMHMGGGPKRRSGGHVGYLGAGTGVKPGPTRIQKGKFPDHLKQLRKEYNRKRLRSPDSKNVAKQKQRKLESSQEGENSEGENKSSQMVTTEEAEVTDNIKKKTDGKVNYKPKPGFGRILHLSNLPKSGYTDAAFIKLAKPYGKVITYMLKRVKHQGYIEMVKPEYANAMVQSCAEKPLWFHGKRLKVEICKQYEKLVLRKNLQQLRKEYNRMQPHSPDGKNGAKQKPRKKMANHHPGDIEDFVTVDDCGDEEAEQENEAVAQQESESADSPMTPESAAETECPKDLGPFKPNNPVGVDYVVPAFYCTLCSFYTCEDVTKVTHCSKLSHYNKLKKAMNKMSKVPEKQNEPV